MTAAAGGQTVNELQPFTLSLLAVCTEWSFGGLDDECQLFYR